MKKVNIQDLSDKLTMVYGDECEKNVVGMIIYENNGKFFFDQDFKHSVNNEELEALLLRGAVISRDGVFHSPTSFNNAGVAFGGSGEGFVPTTSNSSECYCIKNAVFFGDSIVHGVYSYFNNGSRMNGFDQTDDNHLRIPAHFGELAGCDTTNNGKRGSGWVQDTRKLGNGLAMTRQTNFADYDFAAYCLGINDWIQGAPLGSFSSATAASTDDGVMPVAGTGNKRVETITEDIPVKLFQGYSTNVELDPNNTTRVRTSMIQPPYHIETNTGYVIRAIYSRNDPENSTNGEAVKSTSTTATSYDVELTNPLYPFTSITFAKTDATQNISPTENIIKTLTYTIEVAHISDYAPAGYSGISTRLQNGAGTYGQNKNPLIIEYDQMPNRLRTGFLQAPFSIETNSGYVIRQVAAYSSNDYHTGESKTLTTGTDATKFTVSNVDNEYPYYIVTITKTDATQDISPSDDSIKYLYDPTSGDNNQQGGGTGDTGQGNGLDAPVIQEGTVVGNMCLCFQQIAQQNPLCKIVVCSPYNAWGQVSAGGDYTSNVYYGDESTNYALGAKNSAGYTLQELIDAIDNVCKYYGIAHIPLSQSNVCNRLTIKDIMIDGLHPSREARPFLAAEIFGKKGFDR